MRRLSFIGSDTKVEADFDTEIVEIDDDYVIEVREAVNTRSVYMNYLSLLTWNIHKMTHDIPVKPFVYNRISAVDVDIICIVEYIKDEGIRSVLEDDYHIEESIAKTGNQILIAIKKTVAPFGIELIRATEEKDCYNFLHVSFLNKDEKRLSVIGVRMLSGHGKNRMDAAIQTKPLNKYLSQVDESFICTGDYNILTHRMGHWFPKWNLGEQNDSEQEINNYSYVFTEYNTNVIKGFGTLDHVLASEDLRTSSEYSWDFIDYDETYPKRHDIKTGGVWKIPPSYPDHAMMITDISRLE